MPRSGGIYTLPPGYFATDGTTIEVSQHNPPLEDIAEALTDSLPRDGSAPMTGNLPMGGNKITGGAVGTNPTDFAIVSQLPTFTPTTGTLTAGTNSQGQGPITTDQVTITTAASNPSGVTLPTAVAAKRVIIANRGANPVNVYPASGAAIGALATNAPVLMGVNQSVEFFARNATQWEGQISQPLDATLTALGGLDTSAGVVVQTGTDTFTKRTITSTDSSVIITNPGGVAGNIGLSVPAGWEFVSQFYTGASQANVDTPTFVSGYNYAVRTSWVRGATNPSTFLFQAFKVVAAAYTGTIQLKGSDNNYATIWMEILAPMETANQHRYRADLSAFVDNNTVVYSGVTTGETNYITTYAGTNDRISGLRFTRGAGNVFGGTMELFRCRTQVV
jgi:hypothetical protein